MMKWFQFQSDLQSVLFMHRCALQRVIRRLSGCGRTAQTVPWNLLLNWDGSWRISNNKNNRNTEREAALGDRDIFLEKWKHDSNWADIYAVALGNIASNGLTRAGDVIMEWVSRQWYNNHTLYFLLCQFTTHTHFLSKWQAMTDITSWHGWRRAALHQTAKSTGT